MSTMKWHPDLTVAAIVERDGRFLMVEERIGGARVLNQPAGHVEDGVIGLLQAEPARFPDGTGLGNGSTE